MTREAPKKVRGCGWVWKLDDGEPTPSYDCISDEEHRSVYVHSRCLVVDSLGDSVYIPLSAIRVLLEKP